MPSYLVEVYLPRERSREGVPIRYVRTTYLPDDETGFHLFEAASAEVVEEASSRAELGRARVAPAIEASRPARRRAKPARGQACPGR